MQFSAGMVERDYFKERTKFAQYRMKNRTVWEIAIAAATFFLLLELPGISSANVYACNVIVPTIICY